MNVSLTIMEDSAGEFSVAYCGRDCSEAMAALDAAIATGKFASGGVVRSPEPIKRRAYDGQAAPAPVAAKPKK